MAKEDLRIKRTYKFLSGALLSLMKETPFEKITVIDICEKAMVHRTTFYKHFEDKYQLLQYCMKDLDLAFENKEIKDYSFESYKQYYMDVAMDIFNVVAENKELYSIILKKNKTDSLLTNFQDVITYRIKEELDLCEQKGIEIPIPVQILATFYAGACISLASWWVDNDMPISAEKLVQYIDLLVQRL